MLKHLAITGLLKATPAVESGRRLLYIEASNEGVDQQGEIVLAKALKDSADYYLRYGNLDLDHVTQIGAKQGIPDYHFYEIGRPVDVQMQRGRTFVKGEIFQGSGRSAERANDFWDSITAQTPPSRWFPSVGGAVLEKEPEIATDGPRTVVKRVRWTNIGFSRTPVNQHVASVSTVPFGALAKCLTATGDLDMGKALAAGYGTDSAALTGGGALTRESLQGSPTNYHEFRERVARDIRGKRLKNATAKAIADHACAAYGMEDAAASEWTGRFLKDLGHSVHQIRSTR